MTDSREPYAVGMANADVGLSVDGGESTVRSTRGTPLVREHHPRHPHSGARVTRGGGGKNGSPLCALLLPICTFPSVRLGGGGFNFGSENLGRLG